MKENFIYINLNQHATRAQLTAQKEERTKWVVFSLLTIFILTVLTLGIITTISINSLVNERENTIQEIKSKTQALKKGSTINLSKLDIESLYKVESQRVLWSKKLLELSDIMPENMAITELELRNRRLIISAISVIEDKQKDFTLVEEFIKLLERSVEFSNDFESVKFKTSERQKSRGQEYLYFEVEAMLKSKIPDKLKNTNFLQPIKVAK